MSKSTETVDQHVLKDDELDAVAGGEMNTSSLQSESGILQLRHDTSMTSIRDMR